MRVERTFHQQICQQLHGLWSAPLRITISMVLLYQQLGVASLFGSLMLVLMVPTQTILMSKMRKLTKEGLHRTDKRVSLMNEILAAMDAVKCYAWEKSFQSRIQSVRDDELSWFRSAQLLSAFNSFILNIIPVIVTLVSFGTFTLLGGDLTPAKAFTSLSLFQVLRSPLNMLPNLLSQVVNANISLQRLEELFLAEERILAPNLPLKLGIPAISIENGNFLWDSKLEKPTLSDINLKIQVGSLVAIVGGTGEGKTSLISAMLGELPPMEDASVVIRGTVAYVPQVSWIFNATVRDNILFGSEYEPSRYWKAIDVTALQHDLELLPGRDLTEIGERGVNISGGQKQRVSMARAVYSNSDVYIFDDPLSALDAHVGRQVFNSCIKDELQGKTRVLVTNQLHFLPQVDKIILLSEGMIKEEGTFEELSKNGKLFQKLMENAGKMEELVEEKNSENLDYKSSKPAANRGNDLPQKAGSKMKVKGGKSVLIKQEERETGVVSWNVLIRYNNALGGIWVVLIIFLCYLLTEVLRVSRSTWLSVWTNQSTLELSLTLSHFLSNQTPPLKMKFGKSLSNQIEETLPEWRDKFLSYKELKKRLKLIEPNNNNSTTMNNGDSRPLKKPRFAAAEGGRGGDCKEGSMTKEEIDFIKLLDDELEKFNSFFVEKEEEYIIRLKELQDSVAKAINSNEEMIKIRKEIVDFHGEMVLLENYSALNYTGLVKILKKYDKRTGALIRLPFIQRVLQQPFFTTDLLYKLVKECEAMLDRLLPLNELPPSDGDDDLCGDPSTSSTTTNDDLLRFPRELAEIELMESSSMKSTISALRVLKEIRSKSSTVSVFSLPPLQISGLEDAWKKVPILEQEAK